MRVKIPYLIRRRGAWYWQPATRLRRRLGVKGVALGRDEAEAVKHARRLNAEIARRVGGEPGPLPFTVAWLFDQYQDSPLFDRLAPSTQRDYSALMTLIAGHVTDTGEPFGTFEAATVRPRHADAIHARLAAGHGDARAHYAARVARRAWSWAIRAEHVRENPWARMELPNLPARSAIWTPSQVAALCTAARAAGRPSVALAALLSYELAQRQGDVLRLTWSDYRDGRIRLRQRKTGATVWLPVAAYPTLRAALDAAPRDGLTIVSCETTGRPYQRHRFGHLFREIADVAGIPADLQFRDLRPTGATELADAGADVLAISSHTGHQTMEMARRYARPSAAQAERAARARVAQRAQARTKSGHESERNSQESETA